MKYINFKNIHIPNHLRDTINLVTNQVRRDINTSERVKDNLGLIVSISVFYCELVPFEELFWELILVAQQKDLKFNPTKANYCTYMTFICQGKAIDLVYKNSKTIRNKTHKKENNVEVVTYVDEITEKYHTKLIENPFEKEEKNEDDKILIKNLMVNLQKQERKVIELYYLNDEKRTMDDVAAEMGITRQRVHQLIQNALRCMRNPSKKRRKNKK